MDSKLSETVDKLKSEKRIIDWKVLEFILKNKIERMEKEYGMKFAFYEKRLDESENKRSNKNAKLDTFEDQINHTEIAAESNSDEISKLRQEHDLKNSLLRSIKAIY